jgi:hypothetical protein
MIVDADSYDYHVARAAWDHAMQGIANPSAVAGLVEVAKRARDRLMEIGGEMYAEADTYILPDHKQAAMNRDINLMIDFNEALAALEQEQSQ